MTFRTTTCALRAAAIAGLWLALAAPAHACDLCAIYMATDLHASRPGFQLGVGEQFTHFSTLKADGREIDNPGERLDSSITQLLFNYNFNQTFGAQLNVPIVTRHFRRFEDGSLRSGDETGFGDLSLVGLVRPYHRVTERSVLTFTLLGGLELPSGSTDRLGEEAGEDHHVDEEPAERAASGRGVRRSHHEGEEHEQPSGVHGHDLTLGSGSVDGIIGGQAFLSWDRMFVSGAVQYLIRTEGAHDYRFANDLQWAGGPGAFLWTDDRGTLALQAVVSGEYKDKDEVDGESEVDTAITAVYLGPALRFTWGSSLAADVAGELPIRQDNSGLQLVADYRIRGGIAWRF